MFYMDLQANAGVLCDRDEAHRAFEALRSARRAMFDVSKAWVESKAKGAMPAGTGTIS
jgi:hypothetical protein